MGLSCFDEKKTEIGRRHLEQWGKVWNKQQQMYTEYEAQNLHKHAGASARYAGLNIRAAQGYDVSKSSEEKRFKEVFRHHGRSGSFMAD